VSDFEVVSGRINITSMEPCFERFASTDQTAVAAYQGER
jgi:hypothetical protein